MGKKYLLPLLVTAGIILIAVIALIIVLSIPTEEVPEAEEIVVPIIDEDSNLTDRVRVTPRDSSYFEIVVSRSLSGTTSISVVPEVPNFTYDESSIKSFLSSLCNLSSTAIATESATEEDLKAWGLEKPMTTIEANWTNGDALTLTIGNKTALDDGYYAKLDSEDTVYIIASNFGKVLTYDEWDLRNMSYLAFNPQSDYAYNIIDSLVVKIGEDEQYRLRFRSQDEINEISPGASIYALEMPEIYETNYNLLETNILVPALKSLTFDGIEVVSATDPSKYGVDTATSPCLEIVDFSGNHYLVYFGSENEDGATYVYRPDTKTVYLTKQSLSFLTINPKDVVSDILWLYNVNNVEKIDFVVSGEEHTLRLSHGTDDNGNPAITDAFYDNKSIGSVQGKRLYGRILSLYLVDELPENATWEGAEYSYTITFLDQTSTTLELCPLNSRQYAMVLDGNASFYTGVKDIQFMLEALDYIEKGEEIPVE